MNSIEQFQTARMTARRIRSGDFDLIDHMNRDPAVMATLGGTRSAEQTTEFIDASMVHWDRHGYGIWILHETVGGAFVGRAGLRNIELEGKPEVEALYALTPGFWRSGLASEIMSEMIRIAFDKLALPSVIALTLRSNRASRRVMEKAGLMYERALVHAALPHVLYRLAAVPANP
jgi:ribosomal-protein-alanine N-acetyltransferase